MKESDNFFTPVCLPAFEIVCCTPLGLQQENKKIIYNIFVSTDITVK
jgi:hypothetical protein